MATYGAWTQGPDISLDITSPRSSPNFDGIISATMQISTGPSDVRVPIAFGEILELVEDAAAQTSNTGPVLTQTGSRYTWSYRVELLKWHSNAVGAAAKVRWKVRPPTNIYYSPDSWSGIPVPEDAVGIEYEGIPWSPEDPFGYSDATPVRVELMPTTVLEGDFEDDTLAGQQPGPLTSEWETELRVGDVMADRILGPAALWLNASQEYGKTLDLTGHLADDLTGLLYTVTRDIPPPRGQPDGDDWQAGGGSQLGWAIRTMVLRWTMKPPPYRWIYGTPAPPTYRRTFPRDDGLAGGAGRNFPRPRSVQGSNRIGGGYL